MGAFLILAILADARWASAEGEVALTPPPGFQPVSLAWYRDTRVGQLAAGAGALVQAFSDGEAGMLVRLEGGTWRPSGRAAEESATAVARHVREALGLSYALERAQLKGGRLEVLGTVKSQGAVHRLLVVVFPGEGAHAVAWVSAPEERWEVLRPAVEASLETLRLPRDEEPGSGRWLAAGVGTAGCALVLAAGVLVWRRRPRARPV